MSSDTLAKIPAASDIPEPADAPRIVPQRRYGQWAAAAVVLALLGFAVNSVLRNRAFQWNVVADYFTSDSVLRGLWLTLWLTAVVMVLGFALGTLLAAFRLSANPVLRAVSWGYVWLFRSIPILV
ncbi:ABC transporter permease subunit, partial [Streptomyces capoamus]